MHHKPGTTRRNLLLQAAALGALMASSRTGFASTPTMVSWYPGLLGENFKKGFLETYDQKDAIKLIESWDNPRFTQMQANRANPTLDVTVFIDVLLPLVTKSGLVEKLDVKNIPNLADVDPAVRAWNDLAVPVTYGSWGILYNSKRITKPIKSWGDLLRDDLKGRVSHPNITYNSSIYSMDALARLKGGSLQNPEAGMQALRQLRVNGPGLWEQESIAVGWIKTEEIWATPYFSGTVLALMDDKDVPPLKFVVPEEGAYYVPMSVTKVANSPNPAGGNRFIDHMLSPAGQRAWATAGRSRPVNAKVAVPEAIAASVPTIDKLQRLDWEYFARERNAIVSQWNSIVNR